MRGVLIDDHQPVLRLGDDIGGGDLAARDAEGEGLRLRDRFDGGFGPGLGGEVLRTILHSRHPRESGGPAALPGASAGEEGSWTPAFAGVTEEVGGVAVEIGFTLPVPERRRARPLRGAVAGFVEGVAKAADDQAANAGGILEADLGLGRMDVDVDLLGRNVDEQGQHRVAVAREQVLIGAAHRADQQPILHRAAVDEQILVIGDAAVEGRQAGDAAEPCIAPHIIDGDAVRGEIAIGEGGDPGGPVLARRDAQHAPPVMVEAEGDVRARHGEALHDIEAGGIFAADRTEELAACRHLREQIRDAHPRARRQRGGPLPRQPAIVDGPRPAILPARAAFDRHMGDARDRWQRLAAKAQGGDLVDLVAVQLGGGMAFERERDFVRGHAAAVVGHLDPVDPAAGKAHRDTRRTGVDRVLDQLLQRTGRSFHHFTGRDSIDQMFGQTPY